MNKIEYIIVHCSDSEWGTAEEIDRWHRSKGWKAIGYHYVILNGYRERDSEYDRTQDGAIENGRKITEIGAHCIGYNDKSIGVCLVGKNHVPTDEQKEALIVLCKAFIKTHRVRIGNILGHCETESGKSQGKTCPNFDVEIIRKRLTRDILNG